MQDSLKTLMNEVWKHFYLWGRTVKFHINDGSLSRTKRWECLRCRSFTSVPFLTTGHLEDKLNITGWRVLFQWWSFREFLRVGVHDVKRCEHVLYRYLCSSSCARRADCGDVWNSAWSWNSEQVFSDVVRPAAEMQKHTSVLQTSQIIQPACINK